MREANETARLLEQNKAEMEKLFRSVRGFVSYSLVPTDDGTVSVSVFQDKTNADEGSPVVLDWIKKRACATRHVPGAGLNIDCLTRSIPRPTDDLAQHARPAALLSDPRRWVAYMKKKGKEPAPFGTLEAPNLRDAFLLAIEKFNVPTEGHNQLFVKAEVH